MLEFVVILGDVGGLLALEVAIHYTTLILQSPLDLPKIYNRRTHLIYPVSCIHSGRLVHYIFDGRSKGDCVVNYNVELINLGGYSCPVSGNSDGVCNVRPAID